MASAQQAGVDELEAYQRRLDASLSTWPEIPALYTRANAIDQWPRPVTPLTQELVVFPQERGLDDGFCGVLGLAEPYPPWSWNAVFYGWVTYGVDPAADLADNLPGWSRSGVYADYFGVSEDPDAEPPAKARVRPLRLAGIGVRFLRAMRSYPKDSQRHRRRAEALLREDLARDWASVPDATLAERVREHPGKQRAERVPHGLASVISAALFNSVLDQVRKFALQNGPALLQDALGGSGDVHLAAATKAMARVAAGEMTRADFLAEYGYRGTNEFELAATPWLEDPATLDRLIAAAGRADHGRGAERRADARARLEELSGRSWRKLRWMLKLLESHMVWRENGKIPMVMSVHSVRLVIREAARRLTERGRLATPDDVFYLVADELVGELEGRPVEGLRDLVGRRRASHELAADLPLPEMMDARPGSLARISEARWRELGLLPPTSPDAASDVLSGVGGAPGQATGRARIVTDPNSVEIEDGDILVASGTDSAWTPLFLQAAAVVVDVGGAMSHAAIAAREVGIPCVLNVKTGTTRIAEGHRITVDGGAGTVTPA